MSAPITPKRATKRIEADAVKKTRLFEALDSHFSSLLRLLLVCRVCPNAEAMTGSRMQNDLTLDAFDLAQNVFNLSDLWYRHDNLYHQLQVIWASSLLGSRLV